jgi:ABC-2 type transport system ATP-binding protein
MILQATGLKKTYGRSRKKKSFTLQIDDFKVPENSFTAILGPNGSGKSTFIKTVLGLTFADEGTIRLLGEDHKNKASRTELSYLPENFSLPKTFTVRQVLRLFNLLSKNNPSEFDNQIKEVAEAFNVDYLDKKIKDLSKGMRQTTALMNTFLGQNSFYILDEPFNGLDAVQKKAIMSYIFGLQKRRNITILITTHILSDIEKTCDKLYLIRDGRIINSADKQEIDHKYGSVEEYYLAHFESKKVLQQ